MHEPPVEYAKPDRPKPKPVFREGQPHWLSMEPTKLAALGGVFCASLAMVYYFIHHLAGHPLGVAQVVLSVVLVFGVGYAVTGTFVLYLLHVAEREIPVERRWEKKRKRRTLLGDEQDGESKPDGEAPPDGVMSAEDALEALDAAARGEVPGEISGEAPPPPAP